MLGPFRNQDRHDPPQVRVAVLYTCTTCNGEMAYRNADDALCHCPDCINGYMSVSLPWSLMPAFTIDPTVAHAYVVEMAKKDGVRHPLLHNTAEVPTHHLPTRRKLPPTKSPVADGPELQQKPVQ